MKTTQRKYSIKEIADYLAGTQPANDPHAYSNALTMLEDEQDGIEAATERALARLNIDRLDEYVERFLGWEVPDNCASDPCMTDGEYRHPRSGTCIMGPEYAEQMLRHVLGLEGLVKQNR